jgi:hypothetical protein
LLVTRVGDQVRDIVRVAVVPVTRRKAKPPPPEAGDAGVDAHDDVPDDGAEL